MNKINEIHRQIIEIRSLIIKKSDIIFLEKSSKLVSALVSSNYTKLLTHYKIDEKLRKLRLFRFKDFYIIAVDQEILSINNNLNNALEGYTEHLKSFDEYECIQGDIS